jgi:hypothetical protein
VRFAYRRATGGATRLFLDGLARGELWGSRAPDGRVVVPPVDHDPESGALTTELVQVSDHGTVRSWTWVAAPGPDQPLPRPFGFALIQLDGADTALLHVLDVETQSELSTGLRVRADWQAHRTGSVRDIRAFVPDGLRSRPFASEASAPHSSPPAAQPTPPGLPGGGDPAAPEVQSDLELHYAYEPGRALSDFLRALGRHHIEGGRCAPCGQVYVPPRPRCPVCGAGPMRPAGVGDEGVVVSYAVVRVPPFGSSAEVPFAWARILLDGADVPFPHLLGDVAMDEIQVGLRVRAVWVADRELAPTWSSIRHFGPVR